MLRVEQRAMGSNQTTHDQQHDQPNKHEPYERPNLDQVRPNPLDLGDDPEQHGLADLLLRRRVRLDDDDMLYLVTCRISGFPSTFVTTVDGGDEAVTGGKGDGVLDCFLFAARLAVGFDDHDGPSYGVPEHAGGCHSAVVVIGLALEGVDSVAVPLHA